MPGHATCNCPACQGTMAIVAGTAPGSRLRCPRCQQTFTLSLPEAATRTLEQASPVTATLPPMSNAVSPGMAQRDADAQQRTFTLDPHQAAKTKSSATSPEPRKIGRFEVRRVLGEGGFGIVYEAYDPQLDRAIALKVAKLGGDSEQRIKRFLREAKSAANLRHPHIVPLFEFGQDGDQFYLALAYIPGQSLDRVIDELNARKEKMDCRRAATLVRHLAEALAYAHGLGIVHRDIKPHNVMLDERGDPLLMDFGLAAREMDEKLTREGAIMGTAAYLAPEQYRGEPTAASDQYSLGVALYELLTGETPFAGPPDIQIYHHVHTEPQSPRKRNPAVTRDLETICLKCLEKDAAKRYGDCRALADELRRWLDGEPIFARPIGVVERVQKWSARNPLAAMLAGASALLVVAVMVTLIVGVTVAGYFAVESRYQEGLAVEEANKAKLSEKKEKKARDDADERREQAETLAARVEFEHYFAKTEDRPELALVGMASLLPKAVRLKDQSVADSLRLHVGAGRARVAQLTAVCGHQGLVVAVALSADGKTALTGSDDGTARLWDTATGKPIGPPLQHQAGVTNVVLSTDGKIALTASRDKTARLWETATGKPIVPPLIHPDIVWTVALSADGKTALTGIFGIADHTARLWDTATGKPIGPPLQHKGAVLAVALSADGKTALTGSADETARLWETATGKPIGPPLQHQAGVNKVVLSADGKTAITGSDDGTARLWETATGKPIGPPLFHQGQVVAVALSTNSTIALTGSYDKTARLWKTATGKPIGPPQLHQVGVVALSADGKTALMGSYDKNGSYDKTLRLWETTNGKLIGPPLQHQHTVSAAALSADGKTALTASAAGKMAWLWQTATGKLIAPLQHQDEVYRVALSADGKTAITGSKDNAARLWETATGKPIGPLLQHQGPVDGVALSADGKTALTGSADMTARLWETVTGKPIGAPLQHQGQVFGVALSADGKMALTGSADKTARLWNTTNGEPIGPPLLHQGFVVIVALSADGKMALTSDGKTARLWETATGKSIGPLLQRQAGGIATALSADGTTVLTRSDDRTARLWPVPQPMRGDPERIMLWAQVITGLEVDELTAVHVLDAATWQQRRQRLQELGGPPEE